MPGPDRRCQLVLISSVNSARLARCSRDAELLYYKLLLVTDDEGRFLGSPLQVGAAVFGARMERGEVTHELVGAWLRELERVELLAFYRAEDGDRYLMLPTLHRPVRSDRNAVVRYPDPLELDPDDGQLDPSRRARARLSGSESESESESEGRGRRPKATKLQRTVERAREDLEGCRLAAGLPDWGAEVLAAYLDYRVEAAGTAESKLLLPISQRGWVKLWRRMEAAGEGVSRRALELLESNGWARYGNALDAALDARQKGRGNGAVMTEEENLAIIREAMRENGIEDG